jgi:hypothetical protein
LRVLDLKHSFHKSRSYHAPAGTPEYRAVVRVLGELGDEDRALPGPEDYASLIPPNRPCMVRPIRSAGLLVCYVAAPPMVHVLAVMRAV